MSFQNQDKEVSGNENWYVIDGTQLVHEDEINWGGSEYEQCSVSCFMMPVEYDEDDVYNDLKIKGHIQ